jgi:hypothetical protein
MRYSVVTFRDDVGSREKFSFGNIISAVHAGWPVEMIVVHPFLNVEAHSASLPSIKERLSAIGVDDDIVAMTERNELKVIGVTTSWLSSMHQAWYSRKSDAELDWFFSVIDDTNLRPGVTYDRIRRIVRENDSDFDVIVFCHTRANIGSGGFDPASVDHIAIREDSVPAIIADYCETSRIVQFAPTPQDWILHTRRKPGGTSIRIMDSRFRTRYEPVEVWI